MNMFGSPGSQMPVVVKNLLIINGLMFLARFLFEDFMIGTFSLFYPASPFFKFFQLLTHMFMHADLMHLFFNMYALWLFGAMIESVWGGKKFLMYYLITGLGAACLHLLIEYLKIKNLNVIEHYSEIAQIYNTPMLGASGAVFGVLLAFGMMFPNTVLQLIIPPVRLKAIWLVVIYGGLELFFGVTQTTAGVAHFAHIGGMLFGFILVSYWKSKGTLFKNDDY
ncbi:MAG: rhomboid family intramembrane serine protease [Prevotellaceae bacterium]|jgi:membrane associated rhomboid family serine protease|nr:rhomboid family intramembrane serine protease [Prevotellaceae bacterium]